MTVNYAEKIAKCEETIAKKNNLIQKREKQIDKAMSVLSVELPKIGIEVPTYMDIEIERMLSKANSNYAYERGKGIYEIPYCMKIADCLDTIWESLESIKSAKTVIAEKTNTVQTYRERLAKEDNKDLLIQQMPVAFSQFRNELVEKWDQFDIQSRPIIERVHPLYERAYWKLRGMLKHVPFGYQRTSELSDEQRDRKIAVQEHNAVVNGLIESLERKYKPFSHLENLIGKTDAEIHEMNMTSSRELIIDLYERVIKVTGVITDAETLYVSRGNDGYAVINGTVCGQDGNARVESHGCAGYNIVRYYVRTNVYPVKC